MKAIIYAFVALGALMCCATAEKGIPVYVMLPLTTVDQHGVSDPQTLSKDLAKLKSGGITGVMTDVWWGLVEGKTQGAYNWSGYKTLVNLVRQSGLKLQVVMSFHQCGGNVGDTCNIPLPQYVLDVGQKDAGIFYTDREGFVNKEYISLGADHEKLFGGKTPLDLYREYMQTFANEFSAYLGNTIDGVLVGLGPASELRYPSYPSSQWKYCGIGEFQCYDKYLLADLKSAAEKAGHPEWGYSGPSNAGTYNKYPSQTGFFSNSGFDNYMSDYGKFFIGWYNAKLLEHGQDVLSIAKKIFGSRDVVIGAKVSGIHWWYADNSHAAEVTAGYYNTNNFDAYATIASAIKPYATTFDFTCMEMFDSGSCGSKPVELVGQAVTAVLKAGLQFDGENALELCNPDCSQNSFNQVYKQSTQYGKISRFTYLRLTRNLLDRDNNWKIFTDFVNRMANA